MVIRTKVKHFIPKIVTITIAFQLILLQHVLGLSANFSLQ